MTISTLLPLPARNALIDATMTGGKSDYPSGQTKGKGTSMRRMAAINEVTQTLRKQYPEHFLSDEEIRRRTEAISASA